MTMQIRRTRTPNLAPSGLLPGQLGVEMASNPPRLWTGVPVELDPNLRREIGSAGGGSAGWGGEIPGWEMEMFNQSTVRLVRRNGGYIKHNGELIQIPATTDTFSQGDIWGGTWGTPHTTAHYFLTTQPPGEYHTGPYRLVPIQNASHGPSSTLGNEGVEVLRNEQGGTDDNYTLVGIARANEYAILDDTPRCRFVRSWLNRKPIHLRSNDIPQAVYGANSPGVVELGAGQSRCSFVSWADDVLKAVLYLNAHTTTQNWIMPGIAIDTVSPAQSPDNLQFWIWSAYQMTTGVTLTFGGMTEGYHQAIPVYSAAAAIQTYNTQAGANVTSPMRLEGTLW